MDALTESHYYHALAIATRSGYATMKKYHTSAGSWKNAYEAFCADAASLPESGFPIPDPREAYERMTSLGIRLALAAEKEFPEKLRHISHPPLSLYLRGSALPPDDEKNTQTTIAVVGTRRATAEGKKTARTFARDLAAAGCTIASGLAFGIDAAAHEGALDARGITIAVLAGGLDGIYPHSHRALSERILAGGGTLVSEYPPGEAPVAYRFIERNRIMSGIARGVLVVEAPESSGALATARYAAEQNRELFVVPGAVNSRHFKGSHALIRQGAELVTSADDILTGYGIYKRHPSTIHEGASSSEEILILKALAATSSPADVDKLITMTRLEPRILNRAISFLLMRGIIKESDEGYTI